jgi:hypothetical protein
MFKKLLFAKKYTAKLSILLLVSVLMFSIIASTARAEVVYFDDFDGPAGTNLNGTKPDITPGGETWQAGQYVDADGTLGGDNAGNMATAALPFTPELGKIYELSATVDNTGDWVAVGFLGASVNTETRILDNGVMLWALVRQSGTGSRDQAFIGPGTASGLGDAPTSSAEELMVRIETNSDTEWIVTWYFDGTEAFKRTVNPSSFDIQNVAFGTNGLFSAVGGKISSFKLEEISQTQTAWDPNPDDKTTNVPIDVTLSWKPGFFAEEHDIFLGADYDAVLNATNADAMGADEIYKARQEWDANSYAATNLIPDTTYYWRVDELSGTQQWPGEIWSFTTVPQTAINPMPANGAIFVEPNDILTWQAGPHAIAHDVYIGTNLDDVNDATRDQHSGVLLYSENQATNNYPEEGMFNWDLGQIYYWRVDEVSDTETFKGDVWHFTVMELGGGAVIGNWEQSLDGWLPISGTTSYSSDIGVTLDNYSLKQVIPSGSGYVLWIELTEVLGGADAFFANNTFSIDVTRLASEWSGALSGNIHMYIAAEGDAFHDYGTANSSWSPENGNRTMTLSWDYSDSLELVDPNASLLKIIVWQESANFTGDVTYYFDNARLGTPLTATKPNPSNGQTDVKREPTLRWTAGKLAESHDVYFGTDQAAVMNATKSSPEYKDTVSSEKFSPGVLEFNTTYYWRIDEVDEENFFKGSVWSFTVGNYISIDDFEDYNDYPPDEVWNVWLDGFFDPTNGSTAGYGDPDFVAGEHYLETSIVHSGAQSMPVFYDNSVGLSEVTKNFTSPMSDWTRENVDTLTLWYYGDAANAVVPMFITVGNAIVTYDDPDAVLVTEWTQWDIPLEPLTNQGVNLANVGSMSIGFGNKTNPVVGGEGHVFFDDIRLYRP